VPARKTRFESGPVTADLTTTVVHSYNLLINDVKPDHSLTQILKNELSDEKKYKNDPLYASERNCSIYIFQ